MGVEPGSGAQMAAFGFVAVRPLQCGAEVGAGGGGQSTEPLSASGVSRLCFGVQRPEEKKAELVSQPGVVMPGFGFGSGFGTQRSGSGFEADTPGDESGT